MKILVAIDSFKGSMTSFEAGSAAKEGIKRYIKDAEVKVLPIADGGEGTTQALTYGLGGEIRKVKVKNPLGEEIVAEYGIADKLAIIEIAAVSGIALIDKQRLDPMNTTTYGVGQIIKDATKKGCREFIIGIGGSATNDGGVGMLQALGYEFYDGMGAEVGFGAKALKDIKSISDKNALAQLKECTFNIACDVTNPLCGEKGCSYVFAPQKGAKKEDLSLLDRSMESYAEVVKQKYPDADKDYPGAGAAGGLGFAFMSFLNGKLTSGIELILDKIQMEKYIRQADLVITGEGRIDSQTVMGKAPIGIARLAKKYGKPVIAFCGSATRDSKVCNAHGIDGIFPILRTVCSIDEAMNTENAMENMADTVEQVMRICKITI